MTHYDTLNIPNDATGQQIVGAYRKLVKRYHPDINSSAEARERIVSINAAYDILSDPAKRAQYDLELHGVVDVEDEQWSAREAYRMEYIRKKNKAAREKRERGERNRRFAFGFMKVIHFGLFLWALLMIVDYLIPANERYEYAIKGWQVVYHGKYSTSISSYMQTPTSTIEVPDDLHLHYEYYGKKKLLTITTSRMLEIPLKIAVHEPEYLLVYHIPGTPYKFGLWLQVLLLLNAGYVLYSRFHFASYLSCFAPIITIFFMIV